MLFIDKALIQFALTAPFRTHKIQTRLSHISKKGDKAKFLAYIDARMVQNRLDFIVGQANWQTSYELLDDINIDNQAYELLDDINIDNQAKGKSMQCSLSLNIDGSWITKQDGSGIRITEMEKSRYSDSLKRAAVNWGIGRYLYECDIPFVEIDQYKRPTKTSEKQLQNYLSNFNQDYIKQHKGLMSSCGISEDNINQIYKLIELGV